MELGSAEYAEADDDLRKTVVDRPRRIQYGSYMSTEKQETEELKTDENKQQDAEDAASESGEGAVEEEREKVEWPGTKGEGVMQLQHFDIVGLPATLDDESDPMAKVMLALIAEIQNLRVENYDLKEAVQYMSLDSFLRQQGVQSSQRNRPAPMSMYKLANGQ